ncbi:MAG: hypothetical protein ACRYF3_14590 [Janthinobacterium lividum]
MNRGSSAGLAGWVFADALLALTIIGLAAGGAVHTGSGDTSATAQAVVATVMPTPALSPSSAPTVTVTAPPVPVPVADGITQAPVVVELDVDGLNDDDVRTSLATAMADLTAQGRRAAFVLTFGTATDPATGTSLARRVNAQLDVTSPAVFSGSAKRDFWRAVNATSPRSGVVRLEVYLRQQ